MQALITSTAVVALAEIGDKTQLLAILLATLHKVPAAYPLREFAEIGGLMSYGTNIADAFRQIGVYADRPPNRCHGR